MRVKGILLSLYVVILLLAGCTPYIDITGRVVNGQGEGIKGIIVSVEGQVDETDAYGNFRVGTPEPEYSADVTISFDGLRLGFDKVTKGLTVYHGKDFDMGSVKLYRNKAMVYGNVTMPIITAAGAEPLSTPPAFPAHNSRPYAEGEIIVKFRDGVQTQAIEALSKQLDAEILSVAPKSKITTLKTTQDTMQAIETLKKRSDVEYAEPNFYVYPLSTATPAAVPYYNDTYYDQQWNLQAINVENAWNKDYTGSSDVIVAVLDTGIKKNVFDLDSRILWDLGKDIVDNDNDPSVAWDSHGTWVASIIGAIPDNNNGIAGINRYVSIVPVRIIRETSNEGYWGKASELLQGLEYAIFQADADIINLSVAIDINYYTNSQAVDDMMNLAESEGAVVIAAAGNDKENTPTYPASHPKVLSVAAVGPTLQPASYTNKGADIYAPGGDYYLYPVSTYNMIRALGSGTEWVQGTSIASAHVAGVAALVKAEYPSMTPAALRSRLVNTSLDFAYDDGAGLVDALRAVTGKAHARIFVFYGREDANNFYYNTEESTYTYQQDGANYYQISTITPDDSRDLHAWVDSDDSGSLTSGDLYARKLLLLENGDEEEVNLILSRQY